MKLWTWAFPEIRSWYQCQMLLVPMLKIAGFLLFLRANRVFKWMTLIISWCYSLNMHSLRIQTPRPMECVFLPNWPSCAIVHNQELRAWTWRFKKICYKCPFLKLTLFCVWEHWFAIVVIMNSFYCTNTSQLHLWGMNWASGWHFRELTYLEGKSWGFVHSACTGPGMAIIISLWASYE